MVEHYLKKLINDYKIKCKWKLQLIAEISFISLKPGSNETRIMHTRSDNKEIIVSGSEVMKLLKNFLNRFYKDMNKI